MIRYCYRDGLGGRHLGLGRLAINAAGWPRHLLVVIRPRWGFGWDLWACGPAPGYELRLRFRLPWRKEE